MTPTDAARPASTPVEVPGRAAHSEAEWAEHYQHGKDCSICEEQWEPPEQALAKAKPLDIVMSVRMYGTDAGLIRQQARRFGMTTSEFIRLTAIRAAQNAQHSTTFNFALNQAEAYR